MKAFELNIATLMIRFYLMMAIIIISFSIGLPWLAYLAFPVFMSCLMGVKIEWSKMLAFIGRKLHISRDISTEGKLAEVA